LRRPKEAIADCNRAIELEPENRHPYYWRGFAYLIQNRFAEALADFRFSYAQYPDDDWCLRHMAWIYVGGPPELRNAEEARRLVESAVRRSKERKKTSYPSCLAVLGMAHYRQGEWKTALSRLDEAIAAGAANNRVFLFKAMCHQQLGDSETARLYYQEAMYRLERETWDDGLGQPLYIRPEAEELLGLERWEP
jgi:tetratricopeptide (TPR) repeat protein